MLAAVPNALLVEDRADTPDFTLVLLLLLGDDGMSDVGGVDGRKERTDKKNTEGPFQRVRKYVVRKRKRERKERKGKLIIENKGEETNKKTKRQTV